MVTRLGILLILALLLLPGQATATASVSPWEWTDVPRVVAIGDLHGSSDKLVRLLRGCELVDAELRWVGGSDHLVVAGDFVDRGPADREIMELLRRLERESVAAGGRLHVLLGNHEVMNLLRDTRKVHPRSYDDFAAEETAAERRAAWAQFSRAGVATRNLHDMGAEFHRRFPRGFFARQRLFDKEGEYGGWLRRLPAIVKVNGVVYVHGGLTDSIAELGLDGVNRGLHQALAEHLEARALLEHEGVANVTMGIVELRAAAEEVLERPVGVGGVRQAARTFLETADAPLLGGQGPLWYRGNSLEDERIERRMLERSLELMDAKAMVVAHSYTGGNRITSRFHGRLYRLDHGILESNRPLALVVEHDDTLVLDADTGWKMRPQRELPPGGISARPSLEIVDHSLESFLSSGEVIESRDLGRGSTRPRLLQIRRNGHTRRGIFKTVGSTPAEGPVVDRYQHEVAAYRLDRMIRLGMVPVTVLRTVDDEQGSLQYWVEEAIDQETAATYDLSLGAEAAIEAQLARSAVFDALIGNHHRRPTDVLSPVKGETVYLIDHSKAFSVAPELPASPGGRLAVAPELAAAPGELERGRLVVTLGELLSERQLDALLARRDRILEQASADAATVVASD